MRIATIQLAGTSKAELADGTPGLPGAFAEISRKAGDDLITVELVLPTGTTAHKVPADSDDDVWSMAECLQCQLDGYEGTRTDIYTYYAILEFFRD